MARLPIDRATLDIERMFELAHPDSSEAKPLSYRHFAGALLTDQSVVYVCLVTGCPNAYKQRESVRRHLTNGHPGGARISSASAKAGFLDAPTLEPISPVQEAAKALRLSKVPRLTPPDDGAPEERSEVPAPALAGIADAGDDWAGLVDGVTRLIKERDEWRTRALGAEERLTRVQGPLTALASALDA